MLDAFRYEISEILEGAVDYWVAEAVKAFEGNRRTLEMLDAFRYEIIRNT